MWLALDTTNIFGLIFPRMKWYSVKKNEPGFHSISTFSTFWMIFTKPCHSCTSRDTGDVHFTVFQSLRAHKQEFQLLGRIPPFWNTCVRHLMVHVLVHSYIWKLDLQWTICAALKPFAAAAAVIALLIGRCWLAKEPLMWSKHCHLVHNSPTTCDMLLRKFWKNLQWSIVNFDKLKLIVVVL